MSVERKAKNLGKLCSVYAFSMLLFLIEESSDQSGGINHILSLWKI